MGAARPALVAEASCEIRAMGGGDLAARFEAIGRPRLRALPPLTPSVGPGDNAA